MSEQMRYFLNLLPNLSSGINQYRKEKTQYTYFTAPALNELAHDVAYFAEKEGLTAHAKSALVRSED